MAIGRTPCFFTIFILMVFLPPLIQPSRYQSQTLLTQPRTSPTQSQVHNHGSNEGPTSVERDSARMVPTGPDPLHHNHIPTSP